VADWLGGLTGRLLRRPKRNSSSFLRPACDNAKFCAIVSLLRSSSSFLNREAKQVQRIWTQKRTDLPQGSKAMNRQRFSNQQSAGFAKDGANQAEASCTICKSCAIVLGLAGDSESGFTR
jgi:hypothetical protein